MYDNFYLGWISRLLINQPATAFPETLTVLEKICVLEKIIANQEERITELEKKVV